jgi:hypothetical protein
VKILAPPRLRYRPPDHWPLYFAFAPYAVPIKKHSFIRQGRGTTAEPYILVCAECGTSEMTATPCDN